VRAVTDILTLRGRCLLAAGVALLLCGVVLGFVDLLRLGTLLIALPIITALMARRHHLQLRVSRTVSPARVQIDEPAIVTVQIENQSQSRTPVLFVEESVDHALGDRTRAHLRGRHRLGPLGLRLKDPFDLSLRLATVPGTSELLVLPRVVPLSSDRPRSTGVGAEGSVPHMVALHGEDDVSIREYRDGDDLRRIHWRSTAKTGTLMVRQEDRPARRRAVVILDTRQNAHVGSGATSSFEWAVTTTASVVAHLIRQRFAIHLVTSPMTIGAAGRDSTTLDEALDELAVVGTDGSDALADAVSASRPLTSSGGLVVAVTGAMDEHLTEALASLRQPGASGMALVLDTAGFAGSRSGETPIEVEETVRALTGSGWAALACRADTALPAAWASLNQATTGVRAS
jgi:uncharacterized protein (DUF58 family)